MSRQSERVKRWRDNVKRRMVAAMGGQCVCCGYNRCNDGMDFHHLDPSEKEFGFGKIVANPKAWTKIAEELRKCVLVCATCHREVHAGVCSIPIDAPRFDERYADIKFDQGDAHSKCPVCGTDKPIQSTYCSLSCSGRDAGRSRTKIDWSHWDIEKELKTQTMQELAENVGVSHAAIWKKVRRLRSGKR